MVNSQEVVELINEIMEDSSLPKNIKAKLDDINSDLKKTDKKDLKLMADKCIHKLDDASSDVNLQPFVRTQLWSVVSMLESLD